MTGAEQGFRLCTDFLGQPERFGVSAHGRVAEVKQLQCLERIRLLLATYFLLLRQGLLTKIDGIGRPVHSLVKQDQLKHRADCLSMVRTKPGLLKRECLLEK